MGLMQWLLGRGASERERAEIFLKQFCGRVPEHMRDRLVYSYRIRGRR